MQVMWVGFLGQEDPLEMEMATTPCLGNPMDRGAWRATLHGVTKSWTWQRLNNSKLSTCWLPTSISKFHFVSRSSIDSRNFHGEGIKVQAVLLFASLAMWLKEIFIQSKYPSLHSLAQHRSRPRLASTPCLLDICPPEQPAVPPQHWNNGKARIQILSS